MDNPLVSVCMITYNHEKYITQAIESVLSQCIDFDFEFIIANDASTDNTDLLITKLIKDNPEITFKYFNHSENKGMIDNFIFALSVCKGKYISLCEGDDYWTDTSKLKKQVKFLELNPEYEMCFTNIKVVNFLGKQIKKKLIVNAKKSSYTHKDMTIWAPTLTRVFKNRDFSVIHKPSPGMDTLMLVYQSTLGKIKFLDEITGAYRIHDTGVFSMIKISRKYEHKIKTSIACLSFVHRIYKKKYVGEILKNLLELKAIDKKLYKRTCHYFMSEVELLKDMPKIKLYKFWLGYYIIKLPLHKSSSTIIFTKKVINHLLIY
ncbi:glycosyltransferase [Marixanthomonas spongiae]|uniref:Glycosyltransferase 2-like domain-containing protein n=1 Tax=Marixanthomonas spongiae TaxID=2174845 RepID=A0A2U0I609_9FLAO|nr:glycosyltransferase [Marixanthomonas spongiae]PVW16460.1 hypothetical protein DDV96_04175 [Marixanthomonas spongiae]